MIKLTVLLLLFSTSLAAQQIALDTYFAQVRAEKYPNVPAELLKPENAKKMMVDVTVYLKDTVAVVRERAYAIVNSIGSVSKQNLIRQQAVQLLIQGSKDPNSGNVGVALNYLTAFSKNDFTSVSKDSLKRLVDKTQPHLEVVVRLMGFLELQEMENTLFGLSQEPTLGRKERWACLLALARMGNALAVEDIMKRVKRMPVSDAVVYQVFPDLIYTRSPAAINFLIEALNSDAKNCQSADAEREANIPCAYRVMEMLAPVLEGYPLQLDASGDVVATDYVAALQTVRLWLKENRTYGINKDKF